MSDSKLETVDEVNTELSEPTANETTPRITNTTVEGTKKQKLAVKKLSEYSEDVKKRLSKEKVSDSREEAVDDKPENIEIQQQQQQEKPPSSFQINLLTILGAFLAVGGLYFAYRADRRETVDHAAEMSSVPEDLVPVTKTAKKKSNSKIRTL